MLRREFLKLVAATTTGMVVPIKSANIYSNNVMFLELAKNYGMGDDIKHLFDCMNEVNSIFKELKLHKSTSPA